MKKVFITMGLMIFIATSVNVVNVVSANPVCANAVCVKVPKANLRVGPGTDHKVAWQVFKYMPFKKVGVCLNGNWYAVKDVDGDVNWIYSGLLSTTYRCAVVKKERVNIRTGPGTNFSISAMGPAKMYYSFRVLEKRGVWGRVQNEWGRIGWIHSNFLWIQ